MSKTAYFALELGESWMLLSDKAFTLEIAVIMDFQPQQQRLLLEVDVGKPCHVYHRTGPQPCGADSTGHPFSVLRCLEGGTPTAGQEGGPTNAQKVS